MTTENDHVTAGNGESLLSPSTVARMLGLNTRHVLQLPIKQVRIGHRTVRYRRADVEAFLQRHTQGE